MIARLISGRFLLVCGILAAASLSGELAAEPSRIPPDARFTPVTRQEVWQAVAAELRQQGMMEPQWPRIEDLDLPGALPALAGRRLRVVSSCWDEGPQRTQFRLECGEPGECLPFLVYLHDSRRDDKTMAASWRAGSCRPRSLSPHPAAASRKPVMRAGDRALAVFAAEGLRMAASVTCLERGREGDVIRVRAQDGRIFRARVSGPARLEALPQ
ncbi:MAG: flagella basal body P-ring formation protein FlgA [Acidobacteriia bacterium]|nr:flagella basal body P-ring formation protein FlgA [Terriglobia bacterium]